MPKKSAGLLLFRKRSGALEVLLAHPGGPFWNKKDAGAWTIPKGEFDGNEDALSAAKREFEEETGAAAPTGHFIALDPLRQPTGKIIHAWAIESDFDPAALHSNTFEMEWPPKSGHRGAFPEVDRAEWFTVETAAGKILDGQRPFLEQLQQKLGVRA